MSFKKFSKTEYDEAETMNALWTPAQNADLETMVFPEVDLSGAPIIEEPSAEDVILAELDADTVEALEASGDEIITDNVDFDVLTAAVTDEDAVKMAVAVGAAVDERIAFENVKGNGTILKHLEKSRKQLATPRAARVMIACNVDPAMINRSVHEGARYNVYALGKLADAINALSGGALGNAINIATMRSLFQFRAADVPFTGEMAKACVSDKIRVEVGLRGMLVRHTCSVSTASTQASSTMQALTTLGIVERSGSMKNPTYSLTSTPVVKKLEQALAA